MKTLKDSDSVPDKTQLINLRHGFSNLTLHDDVFIGAGCLLDLEGELILETGVTLSARVTIMTHNDPGSAHDSPLLKHFPAQIAAVRIGAHSWIGVGVVVLAGVEIGADAVVGAMALVRNNLEPMAVHVGVPARKIRSLP